MKILTNIRAFFEKPISGSGLAIFRIVWSLIMLVEVFHLYYFRDLVYEELSALNPNAAYFHGLMFLWIISLLFLIFGLFSRIAAAINYALNLLLMSTLFTYEYHVFYIYTSINLLFIFLPVNQTLSLDNKWFKHSTAERVIRLHYFLPLLVGMAFIYFDSALHKFNSYYWMQGLGLWLPGSLPMSSQVDASCIMNQKYLVLALGYITMLFEAIFLFFFWFKRCRIPFLLIGLGVHIGILILFPIPLFALATLSIYILMVPVSFWKKIGLKENSISEINRGVVGIKSSWILLVLLSVLQFIVCINSPLPTRVANKIGFTKTSVGKNIFRSSQQLKQYARPLTGITKHDMFMDYHFLKYNHLIAVVLIEENEETFLPLIYENTKPGYLNYGFNWVRWSFRANSPKINQGELSEGVKVYTEFWARKNKRSLEDARFEIRVKKQEVPRKWKKNHYKNQINNPWLQGGYIHWKSGTYHEKLEQIESL